MAQGHISLSSTLTMFTNSLRRFMGSSKPQEHASGDPEDALLGIEFYAFRLETLECRFKVREEVGSFPRH